MTKTQRKMDQISVVWLRRDLRLEDNAALSRALKLGLPVLPIFIFDPKILEKLEDKVDRRVQFIHQTLSAMDSQLLTLGGGLAVFHGEPTQVWARLLDSYSVRSVFCNRDYEPYALERDLSVAKLLQSRGVAFEAIKDQVIFETDEVVKDDGKPYTVFTPFMRKWRSQFESGQIKSHSCTGLKGLVLPRKNLPSDAGIPQLEQLGFKHDAGFQYPSTIVENSLLKKYKDNRDLPYLTGTTRLGLHLRFGTVSVRKLMTVANQTSETWMNELIWREFFMQILWHFPHVVKGPFRPEYAKIKWRKSQADFESWCQGRTGYPIVDAGMRELNETGFMHNRVRMIAGSFFAKHLLLDWRLGEAYFAKKLLDFDLSANNGNWQWVAGTGCDAAPYFRVFSPELQTKKFDPDHLYIRRWVPEFQSRSYPQPIVEHSFARARALQVYKEGLGKVAPSRAYEESD